MHTAPLEHDVCSRGEGEEVRSIAHASSFNLICGRAGGKDEQMTSARVRLIEIVRGK